jgi:hypothetical protein
VLSRLLCCARRIATKVAHAVAHATGWWRRKAWPAHLERVASNPAYAAAAAAILAGMLGLLPAREVTAAVLTVTVGALLRDRPGGEGPRSRRVDREVPHLSHRASARPSPIRSPRQIAGGFVMFEGKPT